MRHVAIDMSATYRAAVRTGLPHAIVVVDHFHVVQLANKMLSMVRRRTTAEIRGRRGRATDPEWKARRRLLRNREDLTHDQFATMWNTLLGEGKIGQTLLTAWIAKENLRTTTAGSPRRGTGSGQGPIVSVQRPPVSRRWRLGRPMRCGRR
ncbi:transposase [Streptomyces sp. NPDC058877]|uniref:transposase n=1 Tax=Streptomyces sp. NPDC058877 TaxID=3346665 RepID=UPI0036C576F9